MRNSETMTSNAFIMNYKQPKTLSDNQMCDAIQLNKLYYLIISLLVPSVNNGILPYSAPKSPEVWVDFDFDFEIPV